MAKSVAAIMLMLVGMLPQPGRAQEGLDTLVPLLDVYNPENPPTPGFDVAGIRCGGLFTAQVQWADTHPGVPGPSRAQIADVELNLTRAEIHRQNAGLGLTEAYQSTLNDVQRVIALYTDHFEQTERRSGHPWRGDRLITNDTFYCDVLNGRQ